MRKTISTKYIDLAPGDYAENILQVCLEYDSGNPAIMGWKGRARGFYLCCYVSERFTPEGHNATLIRHEIGKFKYKLILEVTRKTASAEKKALALAAEAEAELVKQTCEYYGLTLLQATTNKEVA